MNASKIILIRGKIDLNEGADEPSDQETQILKV